MYCHANLYSLMDTEYSTLYNHLRSKQKHLNESIERSYRIFEISKLFSKTEKEELKDVFQLPLNGDN